VAVQSPDPLAPLSTQPEAAAPPVLTPVNLAPQPAPVTVVQQPALMPQQPVVAVRVPRNWAEVFSAIRGSRWAEAQAGISSLPRSELTPVARAELYTAKGSPVVSLAQIQGLLAEAPDLPQADQLARMAIARGATTAPEYIRRRQTTWLGNSPSRSKARPQSMPSCC
jgi:soluble lytic murein transglycosylase